MEEFVDPSKKMVNPIDQAFKAFFEGILAESNYVVVKGVKETLLCVLQEDIGIYKVKFELFRQKFKSWAQAIKTYGKKREFQVMSLKGVFDEGYLNKDSFQALTRGRGTVKNFTANTWEIKHKD